MEMKIDLVTIDKEERARGRGLMKRVKERWDQKYPEYQQGSWQKLRDSTARFKKAPELMSLILVRQREEQPQEMEQPQDQEQQQQQGEEGDEEQIDFQIVKVHITPLTKFRPETPNGVKILHAKYFQNRNCGFPII